MKKAKKEEMGTKDAKLPCVAFPTQRRNICLNYKKRLWHIDNYNLEGYVTIFFVNNRKAKEVVTFARKKQMSVSYGFFFP